MRHRWQCFLRALRRCVLLWGSNCIEALGRWRALHRNIARWEVGVFGRYVNISTGYSVTWTASVV